MRSRECRRIEDNDIELFPLSRQSRQDFHDIIGQETGQLYHSPEDFAVVQEIRAKVLQMGRDREEFFLPTKDGGRVLVAIRNGKGARRDRL